MTTAFTVHMQRKLSMSENVKKNFDAAIKFILCGLISVAVWGLRENFQNQNDFNKKTDARLHLLELTNAASLASTFTAVDWNRNKLLIETQHEQMNADRHGLTVRLTRQEDAVTNLKETLARIEKKLDEKR